MRKFVYFRVGTAAASEDDEVTGSNMYPADHLLGMLSGTSDGNGLVTDSDTTLSLFLKPIRKTQTDEAQVGDADPDVIVLACAQYGQRQVMNTLISAINGGPHSDGVIVVADNGGGDETGIPNMLPGVTGLTIVAQQVAAD